MKTADYEEIDAGIRELVAALNEIPFVSTQASCEGHLTDRPGYGGICPDKGHKFMYSGDMIFKVDLKQPDSKNFLSEVKQLERKYNFVELRQHYCGDETCCIRGSHVLNLDCCDLTHPRTIKDDDSLEVMIKKRHQVEDSAGLQRMKDFQSAWKDFLEIAKKYIK